MLKDAWIIITSVMIFSVLIYPVLCENCRTFNFDDNSRYYLKYFKGDFKLNKETFLEENYSLMIRDASPGSTKKITTSVVIEGDNPLIEFFWKKSERNQPFFELFFYINGILAETCNNDIRGNRVFIYNLNDYDGYNNSYRLEWILKYNPEIQYLDIPPSTNAFIDDLVLCDLLFKGEASNSSGCNISASNISASNISASNISASNISASNISASNISASNISTSNISANSCLNEIIKKAKEGDSIIVPSGTYEEKITLDKSLTLIGEDRNNTIIRGNRSNKSVVYVIANNVTIKNLTIDNGGTGLCLNGKKRFQFINNNINDCDLGAILLVNSSEIEISGNLFINCGKVNKDVYINLLNIDNFKLAENNISLNKIIGINIDNSNNGSISRNNLSGLHCAISLSNDSGNNSIDESNIMANDQYQIFKDSTLAKHPTNGENIIANKFKIWP